MVKVWLALLLVATLGDLVSSATTVTDLNTAWTELKTQSQADMDACKACPYTEVDDAITANVLDPACEEMRNYSICANGCTPAFNPTKLQEIVNQCYPATQAQGGTPQPSATQAPGGTPQPSATQAPGGTPQPSATPTADPGKPQTTTATPTADPGKPQTTTVDPVVIFQQALDVIKQGCTDQQCDSTALANASLSIDERCEKSDTYIDCVTTNCTPVTDTQKKALKAPCKDSGCGILQVSTLALMLSLLLSIL